MKNDTKYQVSLAVTVLRDIEISVEEMHDVNQSFRTFITQQLPAILRHKFKIPAEMLPSEIYLDECCDKIERGELPD
ncbi:MAG: hypothetical protein F6K35_02530 [Okeania sp. SIO2H7]|nr:hypothetical protein [Okeania sp. SIO2H7]